MLGLQLHLVDVDHHPARLRRVLGEKPDALPWFEGAEAFAKSTRTFCFVCLKVKPFFLQALSIYQTAHNNPAIPVEGARDPRQGLAPTRAEARVDGWWWAAGQGFPKVLCGKGVGGFVTVVGSGHST